MDGNEAMHNRPPLLISAVLLLVSLTAGCSSGSQSAPQNEGSTSANGAASVPVDAKAAALLPASVKSSGSITVAMDATYAPFETVDQNSNQIVGIDADLMTAIGATLGIKVKLVNVGFDSLIPGLQSGKYDASASAISVTPDREKVVEFVDYMTAGSGIMVKSGNPEELTSDPLALCGHSIGAPKGTIQVISQLPAISDKCRSAGKPPVSVSVFPNQQAANLAVSSGRVDGDMAASISLAEQAKESNGALELAPGKDYDPTPIGIAFPRGSQLVVATRAAVAKLASNGTLTAIATKWGLPNSSVFTGS